MNIRIIINGAKGKMGKVTVASIAREPDLLLVATTERQDDLSAILKEQRADVVIDLTSPTMLFERVQTLVDNNVRPVIGTTGLTVQEIETLQKQCKNKSLGGIVAPNFSLTAVLMMRYAKDAAQYFPQSEIIEMHHPEKKDAPSGTAKKTAELMRETRPIDIPNKADNSVARGEYYQNTRIHSVRLPGLLAHQVVMFGGQDEMLTIRQDCFSRKSFMQGIFLACRKVMTLDHLVYGLENILE